MRVRTKQTGVYVLTSPSGKRYVGIGMSRDGIASRFGQYRRLNKSVQKQTALFNALVKYGPASFKYEKVIITQDAERAKRIEKQLIALWNTTSPRNGYNISSGGDGWNGCKHSDEHIERMRLLNTGRKHAAESLEKMSKSHMGQIPWNKGKPYPQARRKRHISEVLRSVRSRHGEYSFLIRMPDGNINSVPMLSTFCKDHGLCRGHLKDTLSGKRKHHRGYSIIEKKHRSVTMTPQEP